MRRRNILSMSSQVLWWSRGEEMHHIYHQVLWSIAFIVYACHETLKPIFAGLQVFVTKNIFTRYPWRRTFSCSGNPMYNKSVHLHEHMILLRRYIQCMSFRHRQFFLVSDSGLPVSQAPSCLYRPHTVYFFFHVFYILQAVFYSREYRLPTCISESGICTNLRC